MKKRKFVVGFLYINLLPRLALIERLVYVKILYYTLLHTWYLATRIILSSGCNIQDGSVDIIRMHDVEAHYIYLFTKSERQQPNRKTLDKIVYK